jgi:hypothetical protein
LPTTAEHSGNRVDALPMPRQAAEGARRRGPVHTGRTHCAVLARWLRQKTDRIQSYIDMLVCIYKNQNVGELA